MAPTMSVQPNYLRSLLPCLILAAGCAASSDNALKTPLDTDFQLHVGQAAIVAETGLEVGFKAVTADSRCPKGENCFSAGDGVVQIWMRIDGGEEHEQDLHTARQGPKFADYAGYRVNLVALDPTPVSGVVTAPESYLATIHVSLN